MEIWKTGSTVGVFLAGMLGSHWVGVDWPTSRWVGGFLALAWMGRGTPGP